MKHIISLIVLSLIFLPSYAYYVGSSYIYAPAVLTQAEKGTLTTFYLNVTNGTGIVTINGPSSVGSSTFDSAKEGVSYACSYLGLNESNYNFYYTISDKNVSVSGPSGGLAFTLDAISALSHVPLLHNFTLTGTIGYNGTVGEIGGVYDKIMAAKTHNLSFVLVPYVENGSFENLLYYISQQVFNIPLVEVSNVSQALKFATGREAPYPLKYNNYFDYHTSKLPYSNLSCINCNQSLFENLTQFTFNFTNSTIQSIPSIFSGAKSSFEKEMAEYAEINQKGYSYTAADFAYLTFIQAFVLSHSLNASSAEAQDIISNVSSYCSSITPPQLTNSNYEYVIGGELRQEFGNITISNAQQILNQSETSDGIFESIYTAGEAYGWCLAAEKMYNIASSIGGTPVVSSPSLGNYASSLINNASIFGSNIYLQSAEYFYSKGNYPAALYSAIYANIFGRPLISNYNNSQLLNVEKELLSEQQYGIWPNQFARSAEFYINEYNITGNSSYLVSAYSLALLASKLSSANKLINSSFIEQPSIYANNSQELNTISNQIEQIYSILLLMLIVMFAMLAILLAMLLRPCGANNGKVEKEGKVENEDLAYHNYRGKKKSQQSQSHRS
ncbi:MAG: S16 family serine protease [Candidatus Micrarchaeia archaeon]